MVISTRMAQLDCDKLAMPPNESTVASMGVLDSPSALVALTGYSPNKASAALTLSSLFRSTATAVAPEFKAETGFITPLDKYTQLKRQVGNNLLGASKTTSSSSDDSVGQLINAPSGPTIVTAPPNKKARITKPPPSNSTELANIAPYGTGEREDVNANQPIDELHVPEGNQQIHPTSVAKVRTVL